MPTITPISRNTHGAKRWRRYNGYKFAASEAVASLVVDELPRAAMSLPIGFSALGDDFMPAALLGLAPGQNLLVSPDGRWEGRYIPAIFRGYPFVLAQADEDREALCIREDSGLVTDGPEGERFFDENGEPSKPTTDILSFLQKLSASRKATQRVCAVLKEHGLILPWTITIKTPTGDQHAEGMHRIDEVALNGLSGEALLKVREAGGLAVVYCQLMSMQHLTALGQLAAARAEAAARKLPVNEAGELDLEFMNDGAMLDFGRLK